MHFILNNNFVVPFFQRADIAITDLTVTAERIRALDFTPSIMNLGES